MTPEEKANRRLLIWFLITLLISILPWIVFAQSLSITKEKFNSNKQSEDEIGYSQAVKVGNTLYISGIAASGPRLVQNSKFKVQSYGTPTLNFEP